MKNTYQIGNAVELLRTVKSGSVDLVYIDPPYNTGRNFHHFDDRFSNSTEYREEFLKPILVECHRTLSDIGNIVVHVEPKISHHVKLALDDIFGEGQFKNEIAWVSGGNHKSSKQLQRNHDTIIVYQKKQGIFNPEYKPYDEEAVRKAKTCPHHGKKYVTSSLVNRQPNVVPRPNLRYEWKGHSLQWWVSRERMEMLHRENRLEYSPKTGIPRVKKFFDEMNGVPIKDVWNDIKQIQGAEKLDYATQKPVALLDRIIRMFSNPKSTVLDPCAGSGTVGRSAIRNERDYILFDINPVGKQTFEKSIVRPLNLFDL